MNLTTRIATAADLPLVHRTLYTTLSWTPEREMPSLEKVVEHPRLVMYHEDWMRPGDVGVVAEVDGTFAGMAYGRLFTDEEHGHGFVNEATPEIAIGVEEELRGKGIGTRLLEELAAAAKADECPALSLSVDTGNPARRLYERVGYEELTVDEDGVRMRLLLREGHGSSG